MSSCVRFNGAEVRGWVRDLGFPIIVALVLLYALVTVIPARLDSLTLATQDAVRKLDRIEGALWSVLEQERKK